MAFPHWCQLGVALLASLNTNHCQQYYTSEIQLPLAAWGLDAFNHPWKYQVSYLLSPCIRFPSSLQLCGGTCNRLTSNGPHTFLDGDSWLPTVLNILEDIPPQVYLCKRSQQECFSKPAIFIATFKPLQQCWKEWAGWGGWEGVKNNAIYVP